MDKQDEDDEQHNALGTAEETESGKAVKLPGLDEYLRMNLCSKAEENMQDGCAGGLNICAGMWADMKRRMSWSSYSDDWRFWSTKGDCCSEATNLILAVIDCCLS